MSQDWYSDVQATQGTLMTQSKQSVFRKLRLWQLVCLKEHPEQLHALTELTLWSHRQDLLDITNCLVWMEELLEASDLNGCAEFFPYLQRLLAKRELKEEAAKNTLLRLCNGLLKRIPNLTQSNFRFEVHLLLSQTIPLITDRSAVNLRGTFAGSLLNPAALSSPFLRSALTMHTYSQTPHGQLTEERKLLRLYEETQSFLKEIDEKRLKQIPQDLSLKHIVDDDLADTQKNDSEFLTLLLAQAYIYLSCAGLKGVKPTLSEVDLLQLSRLKRNIRSALEKFSPKLLVSIELVIEREQKWTTWKDQQCPQFEKTSVEELPFEEPVKSSIPTLECPTATCLMGKVAQEMTFESCIARLITEMDPDEDVDDQYKIKHDNVFSWRTLRLVSQRELRVFQQIYDGDVDKVADQLRPTKRSNSTGDDGPTKRQAVSEHLIN